MAIARPKAREWTDEELERLPKDGYKYELVDGELKRMPCYLAHDLICVNLARRLGPFTDPLGYLIGSNAGFRMHNRNLRCPDLSFTRFERLPPEALKGFGYFAPDLCIEILSESDDRQGRQRKVEEYFRNGAQQVWHLLPETESVRVFTSPTHMQEYGPDDELDGGKVLPGFHSLVRELFAVPGPPTES